MYEQESFLEGTRKRTSSNAPEKKNDPRLGHTKRPTNIVKQKETTVQSKLLGARPVLVISTTCFCLANAWNPTADNDKTMTMTRLSCTIDITIFDYLYINSCLPISSLGVKYFSDNYWLKKRDIFPYLYVLVFLGKNHYKDILSPSEWRATPSQLCLREEEKPATTSDVVQTWSGHGSQSSHMAAISPNSRFKPNFKFDLFSPLYFVHFYDGWKQVPLVGLWSWKATRIGPKTNLYPLFY